MPRLNGRRIGRAARHGRRTAQRGLDAFAHVKIDCAVLLRATAPA
jgi:hypothetical protein